MAMQQLQNRLLTSMAHDTRYGSDRAQEAHQTNISSAGSQLATRHGDASSLTKVVGHDDQRGGYQNSGATASHTRSGTASGTHATGQALGRDLKDGSTFSMAAGAVDSGSMSLGVGRVGGGGTPGPAGAGAPGSGPAAPSGHGPAQHSPVATPSIEGEKRIADAMKKTGATPAEISTAVKKYRGGATETVVRNITDDFGNLIQVPIGQQKPGAAVPTQSRTSHLGAALSAGLGVQSTKQYQATHGRERADVTHHGASENASTAIGYAITGQGGTQNGTGFQSAQNNRDGRDAALTEVDERSRIRDVSDRKESGIGVRSSRSENESFTVHRDLLADPNLLEKVAQRNNMTAARFMGQEEGRMLAMVRDYVADKGMVAGASKLNATGLDGSKLATTKTALESTSTADQAKLPNDILARHKRRAAQTGFTGTTPLTPDLAMPALATAAEAVVKTQLNPSAEGSIPQRAAPLDETTKAWASADKAIGEGRANPLAVVESMELRDVADTGKKMWDKLTGGDGTADGEKLNDNKKREQGSTVHINNSGERK